MCWSLMNDACAGVCLGANMPTGVPHINIQQIPKHTDRETMRTNRPINNKKKKKSMFSP